MQKNIETMVVNSELLKRVEDRGPFLVTACFQCRKCTNGCPVTFSMDYYPDEIIRLVMMGQTEKVLGSKTIWVCASCETCTTRCPNEVKVAELMDCLKEMSIQKGMKSGDKTVRTFHETFLNNIKGRGRTFEGAMLPVFMMKSTAGLDRLKGGGILSDIKTGIKMVLKGRMGIKPPKAIQGKKEVDQILSERED